MSASRGVDLIVTVLQAVKACERQADQARSHFLPGTDGIFDSCRYDNFPVGASVLNLPPPSLADRASRSQAGEGRRKIDCSPIDVQKQIRSEFRLREASLSKRSGAPRSPEGQGRGAPIRRRLRLRRKILKMKLRPSPWRRCSWFRSWKCRSMLSKKLLSEVRSSYHDTAIEAAMEQSFPETQQGDGAKDGKSKARSKDGAAAIVNPTRSKPANPS